MSNFSISVDLSKVKGVFMANIKGTNETKQCLCIPIEESGLFAGKHGLYFNMNATEVNGSPYGNTHIIKAVIPKEEWSSLSDEGRKNLPILGSMKEFARKETTCAPEQDAPAQKRAISIVNLPF